jgi:predicted RNA-binding protein with PUA-like domain
MNYWLLKTEPTSFSWDDIIQQGTSVWDGVRNYQARNNIRKMQLGDMLFIYHSGKNPGIIGIGKVIKESYPDPTAKDGDWSAIDIIPVRKLKRVILLQEIKKLPQLENMELVNNSRLSVQVVANEDFGIILELEQK